MALARMAKLLGKCAFPKQEWHAGVDREWMMCRDPSVTPICLPCPLPTGSNPSNAPMHQHSIVAAVTAPSACFLLDPAPRHNQASASSPFCCPTARSRALQATTRESVLGSRLALRVDGAWTMEHGDTLVPSWSLRSPSSRSHTHLRYGIYVPTEGRGSGKCGLLAPPAARQGLWEDEINKEISWLRILKQTLVCPPQELACVCMCGCVCLVARVLSRLLVLGVEAVHPHFQAKGEMQTARSHQRPPNVIMSISCTVLYPASGLNPAMCLFPLRFCLPMPGFWRRWLWIRRPRS